MKTSTGSKSLAPPEAPIAKLRENKRFGQLSLAQQVECAGKLADATKRLGSQNRLLILNALCQGDFSVGELQVKLGRSQPSVSNDLTLLKNLELVSSYGIGTRSMNKLNPLAHDKVYALLKVLAQLD